MVTTIGRESGHSDLTDFIFKIYVYKLNKNSTESFNFGRPTFPLFQSLNLNTTSSCQKSNSGCTF